MNVTHMGHAKSEEEAQKLIESLLANQQAESQGLVPVQPGKTIC